MGIKHLPKSTHGHFHNDWLQSWHHFSFADYYNPERMQFGALRVVNDDIIQAGKGFHPHDHQNMEIITYVRTGALHHRDSLGNEGVIKAGEVQVMSAGTGITHAEFSDPNEVTTLFQIWVRPRTRGLSPRWEQAKINNEPNQKQTGLVHLVTGKETYKTEVKNDTLSRKALYIHQDADIYAGYLNQGQIMTHNLSDKLYVIISKGSVKIQDIILNEGDSAEIENEPSVDIIAETDSEFILIDL